MSLTRTVIVLNLFSMPVLMPTYEYIALSYERKAWLGSRQKMINGQQAEVDGGGVGIECGGHVFKPLETESQEWLQVGCCYRRSLQRGTTGRTAHITVRSSARGWQSGANKVCEWCHEVGGRANTRLESASDERDAALCGEPRKELTHCSKRSRWTW